MGADSEMIEMIDKQNNDEAHERRDINNRQNKLSFILLFNIYLALFLDSFLCYGVVPIIPLYLKSMWIPPSVQTAYPGFNQTFSVTLEENTVEHYSHEELQHLCLYAQQDQIPRGQPFGSCESQLRIPYE